MFALYSVVFIILSISSLLTGMEEKSSFFTIVPQTIEQSETKEMKQLYNLADKTLTSFKSPETESIKKLIACISATETFKKSFNKDEYFIGSFAYTQERPSFFNELVDQKTSPYRIALLFYHLKKYNTSLASQQKTTPTLEEWNAYKHNQQVKHDYEQSNVTAQTLGITLDNHQLINYNKPPFQNVSDSAAYSDFEALSTILENICTYNDTKHLKILAERIFVNILGPVQTPQQ